MDYFNTVGGQTTMENISHQLTRIADALEALAAAWGKTSGVEADKGGEK